MKTLNDTQKISKLDKSKMFRSIEELPLQCEQAWTEIKQLKVPSRYKKYSHIVVNGMGGSGLGAHTALSLFRKQLKMPFEITHSYQIPKAVGPNTLYFAVSYSGNTEEIISAYHKAKKRGAKIVIIAKGGQLSQLAKKDKQLAYIFEEKYNTCQQPRMGVGYNLISLLGLLKKLKLINITDRQFESALLACRRVNTKNKITVKNGLAKNIASKLHGHVPIVVASEFLEGNAHILSNQINENGKNFATYFTIPELNHHLLEGMGNPAGKTGNLYFSFFTSNLYNPRNQKRYDITRKILNKYKVKSFTYKLKAKSELAQSLEMLALGSYIGYYLAMLNNIDPSPIPWVDYFKAQLKKS